MQIDLRDPGFSAESLRAQVCIIGGGIAGLVLALKLAEQGIDVLLAEAGGLNAGPDQQHAASEMEMLGEPHAGSREGRTWALGGSSFTWGGQLLPLPEHLPWPIPGTELQAFQTEAERLLGVNDLPYEARAFFAAAQVPPPAFFAKLPRMTPRLSKFVPFSHRNLGQTIGHELVKHPKVRVLLHAAATELLLCEEDGTRIDSAIVRASEGRQLALHADHFVLAAGTVETVRLLLASRTQIPAGLGNHHGQVGRNVQDHLTLTAATFTGAARERLLRDLRPWIIAGPRGSVVHSFKLEAERKLQGSEIVVPMMAHLTIEEPEDSGIGAVRNWLHARQLSASPMSALGALLPQLPSACRAAAHLAWSSWRHHRRYISPQATVALRLNAAQPTSSGSRITLSERSDAFGRSLAALRWVISEPERAGIRSLASELRQALTAFGFDQHEMHWAPELFPAERPYTGLPGQPDLAFTDARHLMGGAVTGVDACTSVVDANQQVHGVANLHIASLATFPDGRAQLPTLTLVALTLRLAERLGHMLRS